MNLLIEILGTATAPTTLPTLCEALNWSSIVGAMPDWITAIAAAVAAWYAVRGLSAWRKQLRGQAEFELARRLMRAALQVRDEISHVRHFAIGNPEMSQALKEAGLDEESSKKAAMGDEGLRIVYAARWNRLAAANSDLSVVTLEAEVLWGKDAKAALQPLNSCVVELFLGLNRYFQRIKPTGKYDETADALMFSRSEAGEPDVFETKVIKAIETVRDFASVHLKR